MLDPSAQHTVLVVINGYLIPSAACSAFVGSMSCFQWRSPIGKSLSKGAKRCEPLLNPRPADAARTSALKWERARLRGACDRRGQQQADRPRGDTASWDRSSRSSIRPTAISQTNTGTAKRSSLSPAKRRERATRGWGGVLVGHSTRARAVRALVALLASSLALGTVLTAEGALTTPAAAATATYNVNSPTDATGTGLCATPTAQCTLRAAVAAANATTGATINVPAGVYTLSLGALTISKPMTIVGRRVSPARPRPRSMVGPRTACSRSGPTASRSTASSYATGSRTAAAGSSSTGTRH